MDTGDPTPPAPAPGPGPGAAPAPGAAPDHEVLRARVLDGARALIELLGGDPDLPRLRGLPERAVTAWTALVPGAALPSKGPTPQTIADILTRPAPPAAPGDPAAPGGELRDRPHRATPFTAVCDVHLMPFGGTVHLAHDPGPGDPPVTGVQLDWLAAVLASGLTHEALITARAVYALRKHTGGLGSACRVRITRPCPAGHPDPSPLLTGRFTADGALKRLFLSWSGVGGQPS